MEIDAHVWQSRGMEEQSGARTGRCVQYKQFIVLPLRPAEPLLVFS